MGAHSAVWQGTIESVFLLSGYVDSSLMGSGQFDKAAVLSHDLGGTEAYSPGFTISVDELKELAAAFANSATAMANGFHVGGEKFVAIRADDRSLYGKKGKEGIVVVRAKSCVMIAHHPESVQTPNAATVVENLVDYLNKY
ncbi:profilin [Aspergillus bombycis]|uniref:Profilin n=1 Tax=Aspergillus bombycis TaxID=109264 RepID=A0A1F7ZJD4_9EURO|nr:profilin [Aspergillus bombycis]OGM39553.1 profilin [Aspergillus bombycis]